MKTCIYFAGNAEIPAPGPRLIPGWGFSEAGLWRRPPAAAGDGLVLDDRFLPEPAALRPAAEAPRAAGCALICDFERPRSPLLAELLALLPAERLVVPEPYADLPHWEVLAGPYLPGISFSRWLQEKQARYGQVVLDAAPLRHRVLPGQAPEPFSGPLPEQGFPCPGAGCLARYQAGALLLWDTRETLRRRCEAAGVPTIIFLSDWEKCPD